MSDFVYMTSEGLENLKKEITELRTNGRKDIARQIAEAREKGDLSENAEYDAAKEAQGMLEMRLNKLETMLGKARVMTQNNDNSKVILMSNVEIKDVKSKKIINYVIVSEREADFKTGKISVTSPIGKGLLGKEVGDVAEIDVPAGTLRFEVLKIS